MNNYLDLKDIDSQIHLKLVLEPIGNPNVVVAVSKYQNTYNALSSPITLEYCIDLHELFEISIELQNKQYSTEYETAVIIKLLQIDNIPILPEFNYLSTYINDHNNSNPTNYLGFNGKWTLTFDRPFYQWIHQVTGQGWLLTPSG